MTKLDFISAGVNGGRTDGVRGGDLTGDRAGDRFRLVPCVFGVIIRAKNIYYLHIISCRLHLFVLPVAHIEVLHKLPDADAPPPPNKLCGGIPMIRHPCLIRIQTHKDASCFHID